MSVPWWRGIPPAVARVPCGGHQHELRWEAGGLLAPAHPDLESEQILAALAGQRRRCLEILDAWADHADDLRVLVMTSRGLSDPVAVRPDDPGPAGRPGMTGRAAAARMQRRRRAVAAVIGGGAPASREPEDALLTLLGLGGPLQARLTATVAAAWRERLRDGPRPAGGGPGGAGPADSAPADTAPGDVSTADAARPALHAALYGRVVATLRAWTGQPGLQVTLTMIGEAAEPGLTSDGDGIAVRLPFGWISDVWARGLGTCWDRFCLAAAPDGDGWTLSAVGPGLGPPSPVTITAGLAG